MVLWPPVVTMHLLGGNILFGILVYLARVTFLENVEILQTVLLLIFKREKIESLKRRHIVLMLAVLFL
ncbi:MAG: hypothetical protein Ct9H300mP21_05590 [Pseudomonadota bacterium]|nr:MAG: hypothetical protein Ct9H300mP21_05590 [Pseudomonadota bacterium]